MKFLKTCVLLNIIIMSSTFAVTKKDYIQYLSEDSLIRKKIQNCKRAWICKSEYENSCDTITSSLKEYESQLNKCRTANDINSLGFNEPKIVKAIAILLKDKSSEAQSKEFNLIMVARGKILKDYKEYLENQNKFIGSIIAGTMVTMGTIAVVANYLFGSELRQKYELLLEEKKESKDHLIQEEKLKCIR